MGFNSECYLMYKKPVKNTLEGFRLWFTRHASMLKLLKQIANLNFIN